MRGEDPGQRVHVDLPVITQDTLEDYVRPELPDSLFLPTNLPDDELKKLFASN